MRLFLLSLLFFLVSVCCAMGDKPISYEKYISTKESVQAYSDFHVILKKYLLRMQAAEKKVLKNTNISEYNKETMLSDYAEEISNIKEIIALDAVDYYEKIYKVERLSMSNKYLEISNKDFIKHLKEKSEFYNN